MNLHIYTIVIILLKILGIILILQYKTKQKLKRAAFVNIFLIMSVNLVLENYSHRRSQLTSEQCKPSEHSQVDGRSALTYKPYSLT